MTRFIKFLPLTFLLAVFSLNATGQTYEPTILILSPYKTTTDKELKKEKGIEQLYPSIVSKLILKLK